ncbi:hypothetical protein ACHHYP_02172 [Achlya hypogyna]|uniref:EF-hand domain-containing protein n=1 Tax=Achlya hypogyna TaxID=1202772 RepID=A0A1V9ZSE0_ACHHY|nr:hypothetical protein ACHHYP_02172 [Achlya hypogyna]
MEPLKSLRPVLEPIGSPIEKGHVGLPEEHPRLRRHPKPRGDPPPVTTYFRWNLDQVEEKLRAKIQERTELRGNFIYQQAFRLLEKNRGQGVCIDLVSFKDTMVTKLGLKLLDSEFEHLFSKYDEDKDGHIDIYEFIRNVLPHDYEDRAYTTWIEKSHNRIEARRQLTNKEDRDSYLAGRFLSNHDADECHKDWTLADMRVHIYKKLHQKTPKGVDQLRQAFQLLQRGTNATMTAVDVRQTIKDTLGIALTKGQMHELLRPFNRGGAVDVRAFVQFIMKTDEIRDSVVPNGLFTGQPPEKEPMSGRRHVDPKKLREDRAPLAVCSKRVMGYNKIKGIAPQPFLRRHHRNRPSDESGKHLKATKTTVTFGKIAEKPGKEARPCTAPRQSLANLHTPEQREWKCEPLPARQPTPAVKTMQFVSPAAEPVKAESPLVHRRPKSSGRHVPSPFSPIRRPESPKTNTFQRLPTPQNSTPQKPVEPLDAVATIAIENIDEGTEAVDNEGADADIEVVDEALATATLVEAADTTPATPRARPTTPTAKKLTPPVLVESFEPLAPPRISQVHQRQQTSTSYKSMKPNFRISESTFCCR